MVAVIIAENCVGCATCVDECPVEAISLDGGNIAVVDENECTGCGGCIEVCPTEAIELE